MRELTSTELQAVSGADHCGNELANLIIAIAAEVAACASGPWNPLCWIAAANALNAQDIYFDCLNEHS